MTDPFDDTNFRWFACSYQHEGHTWALEFKATSLQDAKARLKAIASVTVDGVSL